ncbi:MAG: aminoglycoside phosphotransferase family protein [Clostridia bacterium]|nr:aminoglycoside phosphotransferase family protein [Clostridia bacterium]
MTSELKKIGERFALKGEFCSYKQMTNGNINSTYQVFYNENGAAHAYIFQRINQNVFKKPVEIMQNIDKVTSHILAKGGNSLNFYKTTDGENYLFDDAGGFWRVTDFIESVTFNSCEDTATISNVGAAFGEFQMQLADFDGSLLFETIPNFHNTKNRYEHFHAVVTADPVGRVSKVRIELEKLEDLETRACELSVRYANGDFPIRVTHNDTKANNVLFDKVTLKPLVVIDLDTVMPGMAMYDFGDAVRFICNTAEEDEADLSKVSFDIEKFRAFAQGYIGQVKNALTKDELDSLVLGAFSATVELAVRFLDDYVNGDTYFKVLYPEHNLVRARCQLTLALDILKKYDQLLDIVKDC